eukprot:TRINITY_DN15472_c0_g2_i1.p1 TRINITY_DN15472_c0_g2~~TRINITY_DN15472_c0_g2_i1.p1  ORF type:complete len:561 (-),score=87.19 TRINITY_DN15472_c0_g2_i1:27-1709(-)
MSRQDSVVLSLDAGTRQRPLLRRSVRSCVAVVILVCWPIGAEATEPSTVVRGVVAVDKPAGKQWIWTAAALPPVSPPVAAAQPLQTADPALPRTTVHSRSVVEDTFNPTLYAGISGNSMTGESTLGTATGSVPRVLEHSALSVGANVTFNGTFKAMDDGILFAKDARKPRRKNAVAESSLAEGTKVTLSNQDFQALQSRSSESATHSSLSFNSLSNKTTHNSSFANQSNGTNASLLNGTNKSNSSETTFRKPESGKLEDCYDARDLAFVNADFMADTNYWGERCKVLATRGIIDMIMVSVGEFHDFYKPANASWCEMLTSSKRHLWSANPAQVDSSGKSVGWFMPSFEPSSDHLGGSMNYSGVGYRVWLNFWGSSLFPGGCCSTSQTPGNASASDRWAQPVLVRSCKRCGRLATIQGKQQTTAVFWRGICDAIPSSASSIRISIGNVVDYFKPRANATFCEMLTSSNMHLWSKDGVRFLEPVYEKSGDLLGGSIEGWPKKRIWGDARSYLTFWGAQKRLVNGGCCSASLIAGCASSKKGSEAFVHCFEQEMKVDYCRIPV